MSRYRKPVTANVPDQRTILKIKWRWRWSTFKNSKDFLINFCPVYDLRFTQGRVLMKELIIWMVAINGKKRCLWGYLENITFKLILEEVKIIDFWKNIVLGVSYAKLGFIGRCCSSGTPFLLIEYEGHEDDSPHYMWHGVS